MSSRLVVVSPSLKPAGGVIKLMDYATYALRDGWDVVVAADAAPASSAPLFENPEYTQLHTMTHAVQAVSFQPDDLVLFSWPPQLAVIETAPAHPDPSRLVHLVQNVRHANPRWLNGLGYRLLHRPMHRIAVSQPVAESIEPLANTQYPLQRIDLGHDIDRFRRDRPRDFGVPLTVGYTTWKSSIGVEVEQTFSRDPSTTFVSVTNEVTLDELAAFYASIDVFLGTPDPEEGFYMPGLEAMAAGAIVVVPDAGGNRAYCEFDVNCFSATYGETQSYVDAINRVRNLDSDAIATIRQLANASATPFTRLREEREVAAYLRPFRSDTL